MNVSPDLSSTGTRARREPSVWSSTFRRFPIDDARPIDIGPIAIVVKDWSRPQPGKSRLFASPILERMVMAGPFWPMALYVPGGIALIWYAATAHASAAALFVEYAAGLLVWSLVDAAG